MLLKASHNYFLVFYKVSSITIFNRLDNLKLRRNIKNSSGCNARLTLNKNTDSISTKSERNHEIDVIKTAVRQV